MNRRRSHTLLTLAGAVALACGGDAPPQTGGAPDATTVDLLTAQEIPSAAQSQRSTPPASLAAPTRALGLDELGYDHGDPAAPVRMVEFSDFGCGYCRRFHQEVWPVLEQEYVATGKVYWKYVPMILGMFPNAVEAAQAGECAGEQGRFEEMQNRLFAEQSVWKGSNDPQRELEAMARDLGLDVPRWSRCINQGIQDDRISTGTQLSQQAGVRGTPTFFIVGYAPIPGALPLELFREVLDSAYAVAVRGDGPR